jgi:type I restriction enzyme S subunit
MTMPEQKKAVVPRLRFPEFRDAGPWEVKRLGDESIAKFIRDTAPRSDLHPETYVSTENMLPDFGGITQASSLPASGTIKQYRRQDILIANIRPYLKKVWQADRNGTASNDVIVVRPSSDICPRYLGILLASDTFISYVMAGARGLKMPRGDIALIKQYPVGLPTKIAEQQKIADCLSSLDELIELQAKQLEALQAHKQGLMQQLFPREGETTPRLRFPEFRDAGPWEVKRLETIVELTYGAALPESYRNKGDVPVVGSNGIVGYHDKPLTKGPTIVIGRKGSAGEVTWVEEACFPIDTTFFVQFRRSLDSPRFLYFLLLTLNLPELARAEGVPGLNRNDVYSRRVGVPSAAEQQKIADCLSSLDELIELQAKQLEALQAHKKGLMQQLFPQEIDL